MCLLSRVDTAFAKLRSYGSAQCTPERPNSNSTSLCSMTWTPEGKGKDRNNMEMDHGRGIEGCWADLGHIGQESPRQREQKAAAVTWDTAARRAEGCCGDLGHSSKESPRQGTEGCWADLGHSGKESPRQRELKAAGLTWDSPRQGELVRSCEHNIHPHTLVVEL